MNSPNQFIPVKDVGRGDGEGSVQVHLDEWKKNIKRLSPSKVHYYQVFKCTSCDSFGHDRQISFC